MMSHARPAARPAVLLSVAALATASLLAVAGPAGAAPGQPRAAAATASATAATGTIVYVHNHNVWLTRPDGSGQRAVTRDGTESAPYEHPTMSDTGVIAVMKGETIIRMRQDGVVLNRITPEDLFVPDYGTVTISPIQGAEISPDGTKIAYSQLRLERYSDGSLEAEAETSFTDAAQWAGADKYGIVLGYEPAWVTNSRVTLNASGDVHLADLGHDAVPWFWSKDVFDQFIELDEAEVSPDRQRVVFGTSGGIAMVAADGDPAGASPGKPHQYLCGLTASGDEPVAVDPTFGPDSDSVAYSEGGDLWVARGLGACDEGTTLTRIASGGTEPAWSPAALSPPPAAAFTLVKAPTISGTARVGRRLRASTGTWSPSPAKVRYTWLRNGKVVAGRTGATYRLGRSDRGKRIRVRVTVVRSGYVTRSALSKPVTVRR